MLSALLGVTLLVILVVDISYAESSFVTLSPLKVVQQRPGKVAMNVHTIESRSIGHGSHVIVIVLDAEVILQDLLSWHVILTLDAGAVLGNIDSGEAITLGNPDK